VYKKGAVHTFADSANGRLARVLHSGVKESGMRQLFGWVSVLVLTAGCSGSGLPTSPTTPSSPPSLSGAPPSIRPPGLRSADVSEGWLPWYFRQWQPGIGEPLDPNATIDAIVQANDVCVSNLRQVWDARSSCKRFLVSVPSEGRLNAFLRWDVSASGFDETLAGEVVLVANDGRFASSGWQKPQLDVWAPVSPGDYTVLVITYVPVSLPFQLKMDFR
jgi:hypothetical protein